MTLDEFKGRQLGWMRCPCCQSYAVAIVSAYTEKYPYRHIVEKHCNTCGYEMRFWGLVED